ncbi:hypothetical protein O3M35_012483 [Rhynocoris fuscipes]|uniref:SHSP domain-containing protein n=1 Tax=Rhynocoris fuscipes TaxID=488301 RepID=A0AAW1CTZ0_9HEMI
MLFKHLARSFRLVHNLQTQIICTANKCTAVKNSIKKDNSLLVNNNSNQANQHLVFYSFIANSLLSSIEKQAKIPLLKDDKCKTVLIVPNHNINNMAISEKSGMVVHVDITGFNAAEVDVRVELGNLIVEAHQEKQHSDGGKSVRQMVQQYEIPSYCDISKVEVHANLQIKRA